MTKQVAFMKKILLFILLYLFTSAMVFAAAVKPDSKPAFKPVIKQCSLVKPNITNPNTSSSSISKYDSYEKHYIYYLETNNDTELLKCAESFASEYPEKMIPFGLRAIAYQRIGNCEVAIPDLTVALTKKWSFGVLAPYLNLARAKCFYNSYDIEFALADYNQISPWELAKLPPTEMEELFIIKGRLYRILELYNEAIISFTKVLNYFARKDLYYKIGECFSQVPNMLKTRKYFNKYIKECENDESEECTFYYTYANNYLKNINEYSENGYINNIKTEINSNNYTRAFILTDKFIKEFPESVSAVNMQNLLYQDCQKALPNLERGVKGEIVSFSQEEYLSVLKAKSHCSSLLGTDSMWDDRKLLSYYMYKRECEQDFALGNLNDAIYKCNKALSYDENIEIYYLRGQILYQKFNFKDAYFDFEQINSMCLKPSSDYFSNERCKEYTQKANRFIKYIKEVQKRI